MPQDLINAKPVSAAIKEFFGSVNCRNLWIKIIPYLKSRINVVFQH